MKLSEEEQDSGSIVIEFAEASGVGFQGLNTAVNGLRGCVGDPVLEVVEQTLQMPFQGARNLLDRLQASPDRMMVPLLEIAFALPPALLIPKPAKVFLHQPGTRGLGIALQYLLELRQAFLAQVDRVVEPKLLGPLQAFIPQGLRI